MRRLLHISMVCQILWLIQCQVLAQEKYLHVFVTNINKSAVSGLLITCTKGCSTELVRQGKAKIAIPIQTRSNDSITLRLVQRSPDNPEWVIVIPSDGVVTVPSFESKAAIAAVSVVVAKRGDQRILTEKTIKSIIENTLKRIPSQDNQVSGQEYNLALMIQAETYGLTTKDVTRAIQEWIAKAKDPYDLGLAALVNKKYAEASTYLESSYELKKKGVEEFINTAFFLGKALYEQGKYLDAAEKLKEVVSFRKDDLVALNFLGLSLDNSKNFAEAEIVYRRALTLDEQEFGRKDFRTAITLNNLALVCRMQGKTTEAEQLYNEVISINKKQLGYDHPLTANSLNNLAQLYRQQYRFTEAEQLYREALDIRVRRLGIDHPDTAITIDNLGQLYLIQKKYKEAETLIKYALKTKQDKLGYEHPITANSYAALGQIYLDQKKYAEAEKLFTQTFTIREKVFGREHPILIDDLNNLGVVYQRQAKYEDAEPYYKRAIDICTKKRIDDCAMINRNLAKLYTLQSKYVEAEPLFQEALSSFEKKAGKDSPQIIVVLESYAELLRKTNREAEAQAMETRVKEIQAKMRPNSQK